MSTFTCRNGQLRASGRFFTWDLAKSSIAKDPKHRRVIDALTRLKFQTKLAVGQEGSGPPTDVPRSDLHFLAYRVGTKAPPGCTRAQEPREIMLCNRVPEANGPVPAACGVGD